MPDGTDPNLPLLVTVSDELTVLKYKGQIFAVDDILAVMNHVEGKSNISPQKFEVALIGSEYHILKRNEHGVFVFYAKTGYNRQTAKFLCELANANAAA